MLLTAKDLRSILDLVYAANDDQDDVGTPRRAVAQFGALVGCESSFYSRIERGTGHVVDAVSHPADADLRHLPGFNRATGQHPGLAAYRSGRALPGTPVALTELTDLPSLRNLPLYTDYYRPHGTVDQLLCLVQRGARQSVVLTFNRTRRGFSDRDRSVVELATKHLAQAVARWQRWSSLTTSIRLLGRRSEQVDQALPRLSALSPRERQVVDHLLGGLTDREIARALRISPRTVHKHLEAIYRKVGLGNRTSLIALAHRERKPQSDAAGPAGDSGFFSS